MKPPLNKGKFYKQGYFKPYYSEKYIGDINSIKYRSGLEYQYFIWCDKNPAIKKWSSESITVPYYNPLDKKWHKYYVDLFVEFIDGKRMLIEIKPADQTTKPVYKESEKAGKAKRIENYRYAMKQYITNISKWNAAQKFCEMNGMVFEILTEKNLNHK